MRCGCSTDTPCLTAICGCYTAHLPCTMFCGCYGEAYCQTWQIRQVDDSENQAHNQLGTLGGRRVFWEELKFLKLFPVFPNYVQHIFKGGERNFKGFAPLRPPPLTGLVAMLLKVTCLRTESNHCYQHASAYKKLMLLVTGTYTLVDFCWNGLICLFALKTCIDAKSVMIQFACQSLPYLFECKLQLIKLFFYDFGRLIIEGGLHFLFLCFIDSYKWRSSFLAYIFRPNPLFTFYPPQHHVHIRHRIMKNRRQL